METNQSLSLITCFKQSISLTFSNFFAFLGAAFLAWIFSVLSLGFMFPSLMTGLENMYLRAKAGEQVKATDVFMHRRKWLSLYIDAWVIAFLAALVVIPLSLGAAVVFMVLNTQFGAVNPLYFFVITQSVVFIAACYRESRHLHALNLAAEFGLKGADSRHLSRLAVKSRWKDTVFTILLAVVLALFWIFDPILTPLGVLLLLPLMGATSMAFLHDLGENQEIFELIEKYKEESKRPVGEPENPCPTCGNSNVRWAYIEDGGKGDWCPDCMMSLKKMRGLI